MGLNTRSIYSSIFIMWDQPKLRNPMTEALISNFPGAVEGRRQIKGVAQPGLFDTLDESIK